MTQRLGHFAGDSRGNRQVEYRGASDQSAEMN
jgi:hypothetical protein